MKLFSGSGSEIRIRHILGSQIRASDLVIRRILRISDPDPGSCDPSDLIGSGFVESEATYLVTFLLQFSLMAQVLSTNFEIFPSLSGLP